MSAMLEDMLDQAVNRVSRMKEPDWNDISGGAWEKVSRVIVKVLDEIKGHGVERPLAALQEVAFRRALKRDAQDKEVRPLHTVALWLTDTRIRVEQYTETGCERARRSLEQRGLVKGRTGG